MQHHALELAGPGRSVELCGDAGAAVQPELEEQKDLHLVRWRRTQASSRSAPGSGSRRFRLGGALRRLLEQSRQLLSLWLLRREAPHVILVQSPPALPTLPLAWLCARLRRARLVIDWHNYGFAMLGLRLGAGHAAVRAAHAVEGFFGRRADAHLCVSAALARDLRERFGIAGATVLYDRPTRGFRGVDPDAARRTLAGIASQLDLDLGTGSERRAVIVCPTGWGDDEDAAMLVDAIGRLADASRDRARAPSPLAVLVTGRGPRRAEFAPRLAALDCHAVRIRSTWLEPAEYRALLVAADLGLCFHRSASGVDLPMKLADMAGASLPACALSYAACLGEVFVPGRHGWCFEDGAGCAERVLEALRGFPDASALADVRAVLRRSGEPDWSTEWDRCAPPILLGDIEPHRPAGQVTAHRRE